MQHARSTPTTSAAAVWRDHYATGAGCRWWPNEELVRALSQREASRVLEVGCGNGANLRFLREAVDKVVGVDFCLDPMRTAQKYVNHTVPGELRTGTVRFAAADVRHLPFASASFDGVVDVMTSQHLPWTERASLYAEYRRVLRPGGWLFLYHLGEGTATGEAPRVPGQPFMVDGPALFPTAGPTACPPGWALRDVVERAGLRVTSARWLQRSYDGGRTAVYHVMEGERHE